MATRKLKMEDNTKYIPSIYEIVERRTKDYYVIHKIFNPSEKQRTT
jgi:hypothetical protein